MALDPGTRLGAYEILTLIGSGGMGEVYRARDTRLDRQVAVKVLSSALGSDPHFRERFDREARAISHLTHPHICMLHDVGEHDGTPFLVMELLEGETLERRVTKGPLPLADALQLSIQIADALATAHRHGIIHRDLKPGNVLLTKGGAKLLDFGLAKTSSSAVVGTEVTRLATTPPNLTARGTILGTIQYMAPEQLEGLEADARTDIFAFGALVYEMITGQPAFSGKSQASLIAAILDQDPPRVSALRPTTPSQLDHVVVRCLAKSADERWQVTSDLVHELTWVADNVSRGSQDGLKHAAAGNTRRLAATKAALIAAIAGLAAGLALGTLKPGSIPAEQNVVRFAVTLPSGEQSLAGPPMALSPDGRRLAFISENRLLLRTMSNLDIKPIAGTEGARAPFFSPDGEWIGFFAQGKLKKVSASAGLPQTLADASLAMGGSWGYDDTIYFAPDANSTIWKISAAGGKPQSVTTIDRNAGEVSHRWPQVLPGGKAFLFTVWTGPGWDERHLELQILGGTRRMLVQGASTGRYVSSGHLVYSRAGGVLAVPFDVTRLETPTVSAAPLDLQVREVAQGAELAVSSNGVLAYVPGTPQGYVSRLVWVDRRGAVEALPPPPQAYEDLSISPDGTQAAVSTKGGTYAIWIYDFSRATLTPLTTAGSAQDPIWTPDGKRIVYRETRSGFRNLFWKAIDGSGAEEQLTTGESTQTAGSVSFDGKQLAFSDNGVGSGNDLWVVPLVGNRTPQVFLRTPFNEFNPRFSPDGQWVAYTSSDSGRDEVYVRPFPAGGGRWRVSTEGGTSAVWSRDGHELFYLSGNKMMAVNMSTRPSVVVGSPKLLFEGRYNLSTTSSSGYDVSTDGRRFLRAQPIEPLQAAQITVVLNWFEELKARVPTK